MAHTVISSNVVKMNGESVVGNYYVKIGGEDRKERWIPNMCVCISKCWLYFDFVNVCLCLFLMFHQDQFLQSPAYEPEMRLTLSEALLLVNI